MHRCPSRLCAKLLWLAALLTTVFVEGRTYYAVLVFSALLSLMLLFRSRHGWTALLLLLGFGSMASAIVAVDYALGTDYIAAARRLLYTVASALLLAYIALTTRASELEALVGRSMVTQAFVFIGTLRREFLSIRETMAARGHLIHGPRSLVPLLTAFLVCLLDRMEILEDSLKARGAE